MDERITNPKYDTVSSPLLPQNARSLDREYTTV